MAITLTGTGGLFTRLGLIFGMVEDFNTYRGTTIPTKFTTLQDQYLASDQDVVDGLYSALSSWQITFTNINSYFKSIASKTVIEMVNDDALTPSNTSLQSALTYLINQMKAASQSVEVCTVSVTPSAAVSNSGNGFAVATTVNGQGTSLMMPFRENLAGVVTRDAQTGGSTAGREAFTFLGGYSVADTLSWQYPAGSGISLSLAAVGPTPYQGSGNNTFLTNGDFEGWSIVNVPNNWTILVGTPGSTILNSKTTFYDGINSLSFAGNGSELTAVSQAFNSATGTRTPILPLDVLLFNAYIRVDSTPAAGVLRFALTDGSGTVILGADGNPASVSKTLSSVSTTWVPVSGFFRTPKALPSTCQLTIGLTTALSAGQTVYVDRVVLAEPYAMYPGGPLVGVVSGDVNLINGDALNVAVANDYGGKFQGYFDRFFGMRAMGLQLPASSSPTIPDSLIT
jgi:hypothetical protein